MAKKSQIDKFREAARSIGTDDDEDRFNESLRRVARAKPKPEPKPKRAPAEKRDR